MHDLVQPSESDFTVLGSSGTFQRVEEIQFPLMFMSRSRNIGKTPKLSQVSLSSQIYSFYMVSLDVNSFFKYIFRCGYDL